MKLLILLLFMTQSCAGKNIKKDPADIIAPFNGKKFDNIEPFEDKSFWQVLKWQWDSRNTTVAWPKKIKLKHQKPLKQRSQELIVTFINHASVLIQMNNLNIITDPHYTQRCSPVEFAGPKRVIDPGIKFENLPPIDIVLVSHNHYDHLDLETLQMLSERDKPKVYAGLGTASFLTDNDILNAIDMDWWEEIQLGDLKIHFVPAQHWSARGLFDKREMLWGGFVVEGQRKVYFAGDTGYGKFFKMIYQKYGIMDLSLLPIGAYEPRWFMKWAHMNPEDSVKAFLDLKTKAAIGIHFGTFKLTDEGRDTPIKELAIAREKYQIKKELFFAPEFGQAYTHY